MREREKALQNERSEMQVVVPIEDTAPNGGAEEPTILDNSPPNNNGNNHGAILSDDLRDQFETMKSVWRQARRSDGSVDDAISSASTFNGDDTEANETRALLREGLKRKERETAVETAIKVENEISKWQHGIADLEALLAAEEEYLTENGALEEENGPPAVREIAFVAHINSNKNHRPAQLRYPFIPPAIPTEDESDQAEDNAGTSSSSSYVDNAISGQ